MATMPVDRGSHDHIGVAAPDVDRARLQRHQAAHFDNLKIALPVEPPGEGTGEARRHVLRHQAPAREIRAATAEARRRAQPGRPSRFRSAPVPATDLPVPCRQCALRRGSAGRGRTPAPGIDGGCARLSRKVGRIRALAAPRTFSTSSGRSRSISSETAPPGLATKSTAPSSIGLQRRLGAFFGQGGDHHHRPRRLRS